MPEPTAQRGTGRRWVRAALTLSVATVHLLLLDEVARSRLSDGAGHKLPARIEVAFVRELAQAAPPPEAPAPAPAATPAPRLPAVTQAPPRPPQPAASAPADAASAAVAAASAAEASALAQAPAASAPAAAAVTVASAATAASAAQPTSALAAAMPPASAPAVAAVALSPAAPAASAAVASFDWPPSTQLNFNLLGNYRGPVQGSARVEWLRDGSRYQVRMESSAGPLFKRTGISEGELGERGLTPRRFSGEQKVLFGNARRWQLGFGPERVTLTDGREVPAMAGAQDEASQYVQLTWLFTTQPERLKVGQSVDIPLAIGRKLERWTYDIVEEERLRLPFGEVPTFHIKPRREASGGDLSAEIWIAPTLQYLPVRILLRQSAEVWVDLTLAQAPLQSNR
ncbi:DUF3108 domain-containing protein [Ideonella sp. DXS22W]|uniref:DUF3108 domain-containing protein n=1 Tax=Pseudaquabacterium inlustre TaxID=2984192 RepID=A0ABU9CHN0_9BURK